MGKSSHAQAQIIVLCTPVLSAEPLYNPNDETNQEENDDQQTGFHSK